MSCYNSTVPSSPPQNVMVTSINPGSLIVSWEPPIEIDHNGPIVGYIIRYNRVQSTDIEIVNVSGETTQFTLDGSADYTVVVAAVNINGTGPLSSPVVILSGESGKFPY